jgi:hypothetical protein
MIGKAPRLVDDVPMLAPLNRTRARPGCRQAVTGVR